MWMDMEDSAMAVSLSGWSLCLRWRGWRDDYLRRGAGRALLLWSWAPVARQALMTLRATLGEEELVSLY